MSNEQNTPMNGESRVIEIVDTFDGYGELMKATRDLEEIVTAVVYPCEASALQGPLDAAKENLIIPILIGPEKVIREIAEKEGLDLTGVRIEDIESPTACAARGVEMVRSGEAEAVMKGSLHTDELLGAVVNAEKGLRVPGRRISHAFIMDVPTYNKSLIITDGAINIAPDLKAKRDIVQNAIDLAHAMGIAMPKVAVLAAVETVNPDMQATLDAAALCKMMDRGQITGGIIDGPLAFDNAISKEAAITKKITSAVAGDADILVAPDLESGNMLSKQLTFLANADAAGIVLGARAPVILTSRADNVRTRMASCAVAVLVAHHRRTEKVQVH